MVKILNNYKSKNNINIRQVVAYKDGVKVLEAYKEGFKRDDTLTVMSVTKSVTSLLIGIAIDKGLIKGVNEKVMDYFPEYNVKRGEKTIYDVTIRHLLTMTAPFKGKSEPWTKVCTSSNWTLAILDYLGGKSGITNEFRYYTLGVQILYGIIQRTSGMNVLDFANEYLFKPLGIKKREDALCKNKEDQFEYVKSRFNHGNVWFLDPTGMPTAGWGLSISAYDMAQIGLMVLNNGVYNNKRIVSETWIKEMTKVQEAQDPSKGEYAYGYLWWMPKRNNDITAAIGDGGNVIYIDRKKNIVVAVTGYLMPRIFDRLDYIEKNIVEAIENEYNKREE